MINLRGLGSSNGRTKNICFLTLCTGEGEMRTTERRGKSNIFIQTLGLVIRALRVHLLFLLLIVVA